MNVKILAIGMMISVTMLVSGCSERSEEDIKKQIEQGTSFSKIAKECKSRNEAIPKLCPKEHREILAKAGINVPVDDKIKYYTIGENKSVLYYYYFDDEKYGMITVTLYDDGENLGNIKEVDATHQINNCNRKYFIIEKGKLIKKIDDSYNEHLEVDRKLAKNQQENKNNESSQQATNVNISDSSFMSDYNTVMSKQYNGLYFGSKVSIGSVTSGSIHVYVTPMWYSLNEGQKLAFVTQATKWYLGMMGARNMSYSIDTINLYFKDGSTGSTVATWGSIRGAVLK